MHKLPSGWTVTKLETVVDILDSKRVPVNARDRAKRLGNVPYYGATGQVGWINDYLFDETLVILGEDGAPFFDKERQVSYLVTGKSWINNHAHVLRAVSGIDPRLLSHHLNFVDYHDFVTGTTRWKLNQTSMRQIPIVIPPESEQTRIADTLDELFSDLDAGITALERVQNKLKLYRASVLKSAIEGALTANWRADHPDIEPASELLKRILAERRRCWEEDQLRKFAEKSQTPPKNWKAKYKEPVAPDTTELPLLPEGWCWATTDQLGECTTGLTPPTANPAFFGGGIPFFKPTDLDQGYNVRNFRDSLSTQGAKISRLLPPLSILVTCIGATIGKVGLSRVKCATNQQINSLTVNDTLLSPQFLFWFISSPFGQKQIISNASATTLPILNKSRFEALAIVLPPLAEQHAIVEAIEDQISIIDHLESDINAKMKTSQSLRQAILRQAFIGKLVPQDLDDEPASELLKRISAERVERARKAAAAK